MCVYVFTHVYVCGCHWISSSIAFYASAGNPNLGRWQTLYFLSHLILYLLLPTDNI